MYVFESFGELHFRPTFDAGLVRRCIAIVKSNTMPIVWLCLLMPASSVEGTGTFRAQDLSFPRTNSPYGELSFPRLFVPGNFHSRALSFSGTFVPWTFRSEELSFLRLFYKALTMNADSYSNCQNLFHSRPSSVCFPKIN